MKYHSFQNALTDLRHCALVLEDMKSGEENSELSWEEARAAKGLVREAIRIAAMVAEYTGSRFNLDDDDAAEFIAELQEIAEKSNEDGPSDEQGEGGAK